MIERNDIPEPLAEVLEDFEWITDRRERTEMLIHYADQFKPVPPSIATPPYPEENRVPSCESEAYVWAERQDDGTMKFYFAVANPQGISAMSLAAILDMTLSGQPPEKIANVEPDIVFKLFGNEISMGKGQGLTSMVGMVKAYAKEQLNGGGE